MKEAGSKVKFPGALTNLADCIKNYILISSNNTPIYKKIL